MFWCASWHLTTMVLNSERHSPPPSNPARRITWAKRMEGRAAAAVVLAAKTPTTGRNSAVKLSELIPDRIQQKNTIVNIIPTQGKKSMASVGDSNTRGCSRF